MLPTIGTFWYKAFIFAKLRPDLCFKIRLNSIIYSVFCVSFPVLFTKLDNYSEYEAGWPATKPIELLSSGTYRVVQSCERSVKGGQGIGPSVAVTVRVFLPIYLEARSNWNNLFTSNSLHTAHSTLLFSFPPSTTHTHTHTHTHCKKQLEKLGALKMCQAGAVGGPYASVHIKTPQCH